MSSNTDIYFNALSLSNKLPFKTVLSDPANFPNSPPPVSKNLCDEEAAILQWKDMGIQIDINKKSKRAFPTEIYLS